VACRLFVLRSWRRLPALLCLLVPQSPFRPGAPTLVTPPSSPFVPVEPWAPRVFLATACNVSNILVSYNSRSFIFWSFVRVFSVPSSFLVCCLLGRYSVEDLPRSLGRVQKESRVRVQSSLVGNMSRMGHRNPWTWGSQGFCFRGWKFLLTVAMGGQWNQVWIGQKAGRGFCNLLSQWLDIH